MTVVYVVVFEYFDADEYEYEIVGVATSEKLANQLKEKHMQEFVDEVQHFDSSYIGLDDEIRKMALEGGEYIITEEELVGAQDIIPEAAFDLESLYGN